MKSELHRFVTLQRARSRKMLANRRYAGGHSLKYIPCPTWIQVVLLLLLTPLAIIKKDRYTFSQLTGAVVVADHSNGRIMSVLSQIGVPLEHEGNARPTMLDRLFAIYEIPQLLFGFGLIRMRSKGVTFGVAADTSRFLAAFVLTQRYLRKRKELRAVIVVDDLSNERLALLLAARLQSLAVGFVHLAGVDRPMSPVSPNVVVCATPKQLDPYGIGEPPVLVVPELSNSGNPRMPSIDLHSSAVTVGIVVNAWSNAVLVGRFVDEIHSVCPTWRFIVRPHPRDRTSPWSELPNCCEIDLRGNLEYLAEHARVVFGGRTTALQTLLDAGVPVIFAEGLDTLPVTAIFADKYGFSSTSRPFTDAGLAVVARVVATVQPIGERCADSVRDTNTVLAVERIRSYFD